MSEYKVGQTATNPKTGQRVVFDGTNWVNDTSSPAKAPRAKTSSTDQKALQEANSKAAMERDALRQYSAAEQSVDDMGTGPFKAWWLDAIYPQADGGILDSIGGVLGTPARALVSNRTEQARDHLKTVEAGTSISASTELKGPATDRDMALIRMTGVNPYKTEEENKRIIKDAKYQSGMEQVRARVTAMWINKYGSLSSPSPSGKSFSEVLQLAEKTYDDKLNGRNRPAAPPSRRGSRASDVVTIDINGNPIR